MTLPELLETLARLNYPSTLRVSAHTYGVACDAIIRWARERDEELPPNTRCIVSLMTGPKGGLMFSNVELLL